MRDIVTLFAALLVAVLAAAFVVPPFVDWSAYRQGLAARIGTAAGGEARLDGPVSLRLLPTPRLSVGRLEVRRPGLAVETDAAEAEVALAPLLRGVLSVQSASLHRPRVTIDAGALGRERDETDASPALGIDRLALRDARITLRTPDGERTFDHFDVVASAESVKGPFRGQGFARFGSRVLPFDFATGTAENGRMAVKGSLDPLAGLPRVEVTGALGWRDGPVWEGAATATGDVPGIGRDGRPMPWRARMEGTARLGGVEARNVELRAGDDAHSLSAMGSGAAKGEAGADLSVFSQRPDVDRFAEAWDLGRLARSVAGLRGRAPFAVRWRAENARLGGEIVPQANVQVAAGPVAGLRLRASAALAREGTLSFDGAVDSADPFHAFGALTARADDAPGFLRWLGAATGTAPFEPPFGTLDLSGRLDASPGRVSVSALDATLDRSHLRGDLVVDASAPKLTAKLEAEALDIDALPDLGALRGAAGGYDLDVNLEARAIRVARIGRAVLDAGRIRLALARTGDRLALRHLLLDDVGGASAELRGAADAAGARIEGTLRASQLATLAALAVRAAPGAASDAFAARAAALSPAKLDVALETRSGENGATALARLVLKGAAADTKFEASVAPDGSGAQAGSMTLEAPDAANALRQAGLPVLPIRGQGGARLAASFAGRPGGPLDARARATLAGTDLDFEGRLGPDLASAAGSLRLGSADVGPLGRILALPGFDPLGRVPADVTGRIDVRPGRVALASLEGTWGALGPVRGDLHREGASPIAGALRLGRLDAASLAALLLGPPQSGAGGEPSGLKFPAQLFDPPPAAIDLAVDRLGLPGGVAGAEARGRLTLGPGLIDWSDASLGVGGGRVAGGVALRRGGDTASLQARLHWTDVRAEAPWAQARLAGALRLAGAGTSVSGLLGSLGGEGRLRVEDGAIPRADPGAGLRVAQAVDADRVPLEPAAFRAALSRELDGASQAWPVLDAPVTIEAGRLALPPVAFVVGAARARIEGAVDLGTGRLALEQNLEADPPEDWAGPAPRVALRWSGPLAAPARSFDATELFATLAAHAEAREEKRIAAVEADQRERSFFNRRLKFDRRLEADRRAEEARQDALRRAEEARREAARREALRQEALRQEEARREAARQEENRREAARQEAQQREALRREAERAEAVRAARERRAAQAVREQAARERRARERATAPLDLTPNLPDDQTGTPNILAPDPSAAGRY